MRHVISVIFLVCFSICSFAEERPRDIQQLISELNERFNNQITFGCRTFHFSDYKCREGLGKVKKMNLDISQMGIIPSEIVIDQYGRDLYLDWKGYSLDFPNFNIEVRFDREPEEIRNHILENTNRSKGEDIGEILDLAKGVANNWKLHDKGYGCRNLSENQICEEPTEIRCSTHVTVENCLKALKGLNSMPLIDFGSTYVSYVSIDIRRSQTQAEATNFSPIQSGLQVTINKSFRDGWVETLRSNLVRVQQGLLITKPKK